MKSIHKFKSMFLYGLLVGFIVVALFYLFQMSTYLVNVSQYPMPNRAEAFNFTKN